MSHGHTAAAVVDRSHAREWGISAILIGGMVSLLVPLTIAAAGAGLGLANMQWTEDNYHAADRISRYALLVYSGLAVAGLLSAGRGLWVASRRRLPAGLAVCGLLFALVGASTVVAGWMVIAEVRRDAKRVMEERVRFQESMRRSSASPTGAPDGVGLELSQ